MKCEWVDTPTDKIEQMTFDLRGTLITKCTDFGHKGANQKSENVKVRCSLLAK